MRDKYICLVTAFYFYTSINMLINNNIFQPGFFLGIAHAIGGTTDFNKIIKIIAEGDNYNVDELEVSQKCHS